MRHEQGSKLSEDEAGQRDLEREHAASDPALMEAIRDGSRASLGILMQEYWNSLVAYAAAIAGSADDGEDVARETFVQVWRQRASWTPSDPVNAYLYRITRNLALNVRRNGSARPRGEERGSAELFGAGSSTNPDRDIETEPLHADVAAAIADLPKRRREVFALSRFHGLTQAEIAQTLGLSPQAVAKHMSAALTGLRQALSQHLHEEG